MLDEKTCVCLIWVLISVGSGCIVAGCVTTYWQGLHDSHFGLWEWCFESYCTKLKSTYNSGQLNVIRGLLVLGVCFIFLTTVLCLVGICMKKKFSTAIMVIELLTLISCLTAMALYTQYMKQPVYEYEWSYILSWLGCSLYSLGVAMTIVVHCMA